MYVYPNLTIEELEQYEEDCLCEADGWSRRAERFVGAENRYCCWAAGMALALATKLDKVITIREQLLRYPIKIG